MLLVNMLSKWTASDNSCTWREIKIMGLYNSAIWTQLGESMKWAFALPSLPLLMIGRAYLWLIHSWARTHKLKTHTHPGENKFNLKAQKIKQPRLNEAINLMKQSFNKVKVRICIHIHTHSHKADTSNIYTPAKQDREHRHTWKQENG